MKTILSLCYIVSFACTATVVMKSRFLCWDEEEKCAYITLSKDQMSRCPALKTIIRRMRKIGNDITGEEQPLVFFKDYSKKTLELYFDTVDNFSPEVAAKRFDALSPEEKFEQSILLIELANYCLNEDYLNGLIDYLYDLCISTDNVRIAEFLEEEKLQFLPVEKLSCSLAKKLKAKSKELMGEGQNCISDPGLIPPIARIVNSCNETKGSVESWINHYHELCILPSVRIDSAFDGLKRTPFVGDQLKEKEDLLNLFLSKFTPEECLKKFELFTLVFKAMCSCQNIKELEIWINYLYVYYVGKSKESRESNHGELSKMASFVNSLDENFTRLFFGRFTLEEFKLSGLEEEFRPKYLTSIEYLDIEIGYPEIVSVELRSPIKKVYYMSHFGSNYSFKNDYLLQLSDLKKLKCGIYGSINKQDGIPCLCCIIKKNSQLDSISFQVPNSTDPDLKGISNVFQEISKLVHLRELSIENCRSPKSLLLNTMGETVFTNIVRLNLVGFNFSITEIESLFDWESFWEKFTKLKELRIENSTFDSKNAASFFDSLPSKLVKFSFLNNWLPGENLKLNWDKFEGLEAIEVKLSREMLTGKIPLEGLSSASLLSKHSETLKVLDLQGNDLKDSFFQDNFSLKSLETLRLSNNHFVDGTHLAKFIENCPNLKELFIENCGLISAFIVTLVKISGKFEKLDLRSNNFNALTVGDLLAQNTTLTHLAISSAVFPSRTENGLIFVLEHLKHLEIDYNERKELLIKDIAGIAPNLETLIFHNLDGNIDSVWYYMFQVTNEWSGFENLSDLSLRVHPDYEIELKRIIKNTEGSMFLSRLKYANLPRFRKLRLPKCFSPDFLISTEKKLRKNIPLFEGVVVE